MSLPPPAQFDDEPQDADDALNPFAENTNDEQYEYYEDYEEVDTNNAFQEAQVAAPSDAPPNPVIPQSVSATSPKSPQKLDNSMTNGTPEPPNDDEQTGSAEPPLQHSAYGSMPPPPPAFSSNAHTPPKSPDRLHHHSPALPPMRPLPKRARSGHADVSGPSAPKIHGTHAYVKSEPQLQLGTASTDEMKHEAIDDVSFTDILRQVDVGVEMTDRLKEVVRKFCKHQQMGADKLQEIYGKLPSTYQENDGMKEFADLCALVHTLILETVSAQKRLADFLFKDVVPKMDTYIKEKQQQIQQLKRDNQQAEMKLKNSINAMNKASQTAKQSALKAKQMGTAAAGQKKYDKKKKGGLGGVLNKLKNNPNAALPDDEQAYLKAQTNQSKYEASVMAANYEQDTYDGIVARFKRDCKSLEQQRIQYCQSKIQQLVNAHRSYFNNETIMVLQTRILSGLDALDATREFDTYIAATLAAHNNAVTPKIKYEAKKYDYQNVFHSLQDSMDITLKLTPHAKLPLILTTLCNKVRELNGFDTEGIFRKSAAQTEIDRYKAKLSSNDYAVDTKDAHVAACLLKDWLRGLKDSLIPQTHYEMALQMAKKNEVKQEALEVFLSQLPEVNRETIKYLIKFLQELIDEKHSSKTKMNVENVAIVFAPTILKCPSDDPKLLLANSKHEKDFTIALINELHTY